MEKELQELIIKGSIIGQLVGDAIGYHYRFTRYPNRPLHSDIDMLPGPQPFRREGVYTHSSALSVCTMSSMNDMKGVDLDDIFSRFHDCLLGGYMNYDGEDYYLGLTSSQAIKNYSNGMPPDLCGLRGKNATDGEAMLRMLPIALWFVNDPCQLIEVTHKVCSITHNSPICQACSALYGLLIRNLFVEEPGKVFDILGSYYTDRTLDGHKAALEIISSSSDKDDGEEDAPNIFWTAWNTFSANEDNYSDCIRKTVSIGGAANCTAGIAGSMSGLVNGLTDIPSNWLRNLKLSPESMDTIETFVQNIIRRLG